MKKHLILIADDDASILRLVRTRLQADGYGVISASNGREAVDLFEDQLPDLVILDVMMPVTDGLQAMHEIRETSTVPVILLTARTGPQDKISGLDMGADDYVTKPFNPDELSARVAAILRRAGGSVAHQNEVLQYEHVTIDLSRRFVTVRGKDVRLSRTEWELLHLLASNAGRVMLHAELLSRIWGPEFRDETYYLRTWVSRLRTKLEDKRNDPELITTFPGMGYRLESPDGTG